MTVVERSTAAQPVDLGGMGAWAGARPSARKPVAPVVMAFDALALVAGFAVGAICRGFVAGPTEGPVSWVVSLLHEAPYAPLYLLTMGMYGLYARPFRCVRRSWFVDYGQLVRSLVAGSVMVAALSSGLHRFASLPKLGWVEVGAMAAPALALVPVSRGVATRVIRLRGGHRIRVAVVGSSSAADRLVRRLQRLPDLELVGLVMDGDCDRPYPTRILGGTADLLSICERNGLERIFVSSGGHDAVHLGGIIRHLPPGVRVSVVPTFSDLLTWQSRIEDLDGLTIMDVPPAQMGAGRRAMKRAIDVVFAAVALILLSPVLVAVAVAVKVSSPGPVFFRQTRVGYLGKPFLITKFRTMTTGADGMKVDLRDANDGDGPMFKIRRDPRVTPLGRFLRRSSLDEFPQLFHVITGQMSLVGPRPLVPEESACFDGWAARRFEVKPGITGLWQVSGRSDLPFEEIRQLDYAYAASWSLWWDLKILWQTPASVLRGRGAY
ncbi:MAG TPA: sugar transferase [Acidimicrobiales bacterium]|nr:sugar transferase [Acidimicrobiales bacterium]